MPYRKYNPAYDPKELGIESFILYEPNLSYEFNDLLFIRRLDNNQVFVAQSSGCSCPIPFEEYEGATLDDVCQLMERVGTLKQAEDIITNYSKTYRYGEKEEYFLDMGERQKALQTLREWGLR